MPMSGRTILSINLTFKYMKKIIYFSIVLLITSSIFMACSKQENDDLNYTNSLEIEGIIAFNTKTKKTYVKEVYNIVSREKTKENFNKDYEIHTIKSSFKCDKKMPSFAS